ncbi:3-deoxy-7-phosphoheptulonate synthase [Streptomyces marispadix]|uniref:Phospho-2-dehydro-3-deoxyheptonate aldolase n=1 Tax=Streptomyces marispadix TaxID=2922868 RepID=A0ABS9T244_9ACTN|nr:3-deoxy-7-phosphoheptulonate synthase [Streptomyces marispadix]MCH6162579.1 3-deoxy-7-phosphoheptulonate synthase [Streptomyces marispadix]
MPSVTLATQRTAAQQPQWEDEEELVLAAKELASRPAPVSADACHALRHRLAAAARGEAFVVQGGDCAERFGASSAEPVRTKIRQLRQLGTLVEELSGLDAVLIGRIAGQYAKPRSNPTETVGGLTLPVYRGDAVNSPEPHPDSRRPDPRRLVRAYDHATEVLTALAAHGGRPGAAEPGTTRVAPVFTSHEALLLDYERPLIRPDEVAGGSYGSSGHMLWIGERTRQLDGAHVHFAEQVNNPVGVKLGPSAEPADVRALCKRFDRYGPPGRLTLISRMGRGAVTERLPRLVEAAAPFAGRVVWLCDPMHGNTLPHVSGRKSRVLTDVREEVRGFFAVLRDYGAHPCGLHLETTPEPVTECVPERDDLECPGALTRYTSACDPRLNAEQAAELVAFAARLL